MRSGPTRRRQLLKAAGLAGATAMAGCVGGGDGSDGSDGSDGNDDGDGSDGGTDFSGRELNVLTWAGYGGVAGTVEDDTGASVNISLISSDVEGFNTLNGGGTSQFDLLVLDNDWAVRNARADNILPVEESDYPNRDDWVEDFQWPYETFQDGGEVWAIPPRWGWGGLGYDDREVDLGLLEEKGYSVVWTGGPDNQFEDEVTLADWPTWVIPLVILQLFDLDGRNPMDVELSDDQLDELEETLVAMFENATAIHTGAAALRQDMLEGNAKLVFGTGNFGLSQLPAEGNDWMKCMFPPDVGGWYWVEGICLVNNSELDRELAVEFQNACLTPEGQYSICYGDAESKGAPVNRAAFDEFSEEEQRQIMMYNDQGFEAADELLENLYQYVISPQQDQWLDMWERAKANADI
jgi:spermidine/putrescine-binding protein